MDDRSASRLILAAIALAAVAARSAYGQDASGEPNTFPFQLLKWSAADQAAWVNSTLDKGMPPDLGGALTILAINKSSLVLPLMEQKIEQVLQSPSPAECFTDKTVNPEKFVYLDAATIAYAGNDEAMRQVAKLVKLDEKRFDDLVGRTLMETESLGNPENRGDPYIVAYHALEIGEPLVEKRIHAWVQARFSEKAEDRVRDLRKFWAEAMVDRYNGVPTESQWATDPFVSRLNPSDEPAVHKDMLGYAIAVVERRAKR
jgi:hypothetical protein